MSIKVMTMVFDRYPEGGNERLLALAIADHARDDGTRIWPSVAELARKTLQSERTVQRQIANMVGRGWLEVVRRATGRPGDTNEYRICAGWIAGGDLPQTGDNLTPVTGDRLTPVSRPLSVDKVVHTGDTTGETGDTTGETGDTAMSPESSGTVRNRNPLTPVDTGECGQAGQPKAGHRAPWRWRKSWERLCRHGAGMGIPFSTDPLGSSWTDAQLQQHKAAYRVLVEVEHERRYGSEA